MPRFTCQRYQNNRSSKAVAVYIFRMTAKYNTYFDLSHAEDSWLKIITQLAMVGNYYVVIQINFTMIIHKGINTNLLNS